jgi:energy-coupling factor transporter ATP-binding protein EcfA2
MRVEVENLQGFRQAVLDLADARGKPRRTTVLLGDNGSGKSTLLRVIALGLAQPRDVKGMAEGMLGVSGRGERDQARIHVELVETGPRAERVSVTTWIDTAEDGTIEVRRETVPDRAFPWPRLLVCGYGAGRGQPTQHVPGKHVPRHAVASLFQRDARLLAPEALGEALDTALARHCQSLLGLDFAVAEPGDGAHATAAWLGDLLGRAQLDGALDAESKPAGIALVDAVDAHLHPSRQRQILGRLARLFPDLQIVATAHSPETVVNLETREVAVCHRQGSFRAVIQDLPPPTGRNADELLRGPWFGLPATVDDDTAALLAAYRERVRAGASEKERTRLRESVRDRVGYFVATPLDELVAEVLAVLEDEVLGRASGKAPGPPPGEPLQAGGEPSQAEGEPLQAEGEPSQTEGEPLQAESEPSQAESEPSQALPGSGELPDETRRALIEAAVRALRRRLEEHET